MSVAAIIRDQIGAKALFMIGAKNISSLEGKGLSMRIGRNPKRITHITIMLDPSDTYTLKFIRMPGMKFTLVSEEHDIYADDLRDSIERNTGLRTSLGTMGR